MKKLSRMAALGLALALTFGMTVNAEESPTTEGVAPELKEEQVKEYTEKSETLKEAVSEVTVVVGGQTVTLDKKTVAPETLYEAVQIAAGKAAEVTADLKLDVPEGKKIETNVVGAADIDITGITIPEDGLELTISIDGIKEGSKYILLHLTGGKWETILPTSVADGRVTAKFTSLSPVVASEVTVVELTGDEEDEDDGPAASGTAQAAAANPATSPKTAETLPAAGVMALIALAGAAVCANKIRYNR